MMRRALVILAAFWLLLAAARGGTLPSAGGREHGVLALPTILNPPPKPPRLTPGPPEPMPPEAEDDADIYHLPASQPPGTVRPGPHLSRTPLLMAARDARIVMVYPSPSAEDPPAVRAGSGAKRRVESMTIASVTEGMYAFEPVGREPEALASLPGWGTVEGLVVLPLGPAALLRDARGAEAPALLVLRGVEWSPAPLPDGPDAALPWRLLALRDRVALVEVPRQGESARVWWALAKDLQAAASEEALTGPLWRQGSMAAPRASESLLAAGGQIIAASRADSDTVRLRMLRVAEGAEPDGEPHPSAEAAAYDLIDVPGVGSHYAVIPTGDRVNVVWMRDSDRRLLVHSVSATTGRVLHEGFARTEPLVTGAELQRMVLLLGTVLLTILLFVLRPEAADRQVITLPDGAALSDPWRRIAAAMIDLLIPMALCAWVFGVPASDMAAAMVFSSSASLRGFVVFLLAVSLTVAHSALGEAAGGRTLGKALTACRSVSVSGATPSVWQALVRNTLKWLFPPLAMLMLVDPSRRHPADVAAKTVVIVRARGSGAGGEPGSSEPPRSR